MGRPTLGERAMTATERQRRHRAQLAQNHWRKIKKARQRLVLCRLMIDMMRTVHGAYAPASEPFGARLETFYIALCVALGDIDGKPFSVAKIVVELGGKL